MVVEAVRVVEVIYQVKKYERQGVNKMAKSEIIDRLKGRGLRITNQRKVLIDTILESECSSSKEIYYNAIKKDPNIGMATVYRMIKVLEDAEVLERRKLAVRV